MTIREILEQARALSPQERKELAKRLIDMIDEVSTSTSHTTEDHWGKALNQLLDEIGPIELKYPEIEDPVAWVKHARQEKQNQRFGDESEAG